ncbi:MAG: DevR family CRISPR-associated autoregulator [Anaerolineae bacterium]|nr:DevR family CRISPR-associated autoregulator [Anaerolineae bacterium]
MATELKSLSLAARVVLDMHALNNEGSESNRLMTREVGIVTPVYDEQGGLEDYARSTVNAISGDMLKHIFADHFRHIALERRLPVCEACKDLDPARMMGNPEFQEFVNNTKEGAEIVDKLLECALDDVCGILITAGGNSIKRKSAVEFGWTVGLPDYTEVQEFIHARHAVRRITRTKAGRGDDKEVRDQAIKEKEENLGQMIFNRPATSGVYAFVAHLDVNAIGFNDIRGLYPDHVTDRTERLQAALLALAQTLTSPEGALTSTQLPHVVEMEGLLSVSTSAAAAPLVSPLHDDYVGRAERTAQTLNKLYGNTVGVLSFQGQEGLLEQMAQIVEGYDAGRYGGR